MTKWIGLWLCSLCLVFAAGYYVNDKRATVPSEVSVHITNVGDGKVNTSHKQRYSLSKERPSVSSHPKTQRVNLTILA